MNLNIITIVGIGIITCVLTIILRKWKPEFAMVISLCGGMIILLMVLFALSSVLNNINDIIEKTGIASFYGKILFKALGICFVAQLASDTCRDSGETAIATKIDIAAKTAVLIIALPLFEKLLNVITNLLN
ncbi:MAG: stage III sporulation AC/AD family protein [Oscillospiraceae bacterium]